MPAAQSKPRPTPRQRAEKLLEQARAVPGLAGDFERDLATLVEELKAIENTSATLAGLGPQVDDLNLYVAYISCELEVRYANHLFARAFGHTQASIAGQPLAGVISPRMFDGAMPIMERVFHERRAITWVDHTDTPGQRTDAQLTFLPIFEGEHPAGVLMFGIDLSEELQQFKAQLAQDHLYKVIVETSDDGILQFDLQGKPLFRNAAYFRNQGYAPGEPLEHEGITRVHPDDREALARQVQAQLEQGTGRNGSEHEYRALHRDGSYRYHQMKISVLPDEQGKPASLLAIVRDVTARKLQHDELQRARIEAEEANRAKSEFLANMSHEIRTPIHGILNLATLSLDETRPEHVSGNLVMIAQAAEMLHSLVSDVLDMAKIEAKRLDLSSLDFSPAEICAQSMAAIDALCDRKGIETRVRIEPGLPRHLVGDPVRLRQIILNLLKNAAKFTHQGQICLSVGGAPEGPGSFRLEVSVSDTGIGIEPAQIARVFEPFRQADGSRVRKYEGTGLGLSIVQALVEQMNGAISVESKPDAGSTFTVRIPLPLPARSETRPPAPPQSAPPPSMRATVLVVEDNPLNMKIAVRIVQKAGHNVLQAFSGPEALGLLNERHVDLILMDIQMPDMDGLELTRLLRDNNLVGPHTPIIALTANALSDDRDRCLRAGMNDYLSKPFTPADLADIVQRYLAPGG